MVPLSFRAKMKERTTRTAQTTSKKRAPKKRPDWSLNITTRPNMAPMKAHKVIPMDIIKLTVHTKINKIKIKINK